VTSLMSGPQFIRPQFTGLSGLGKRLKWLEIQKGACRCVQDSLLASGGNFEHVILFILTDTNGYI